MEIIWRDVAGYEGLYKVSDNGKVKSVDRYVEGKIGSKRLIKGKEMKIQKSRKGYSVIVLHKNGIAKTKQVHRLVAEAFIPNLLNLPQVNHKDTNKDNNNVFNLEWITNYDNMQHAIKNGCYKGFTEKQRESVIKNLKYARKNKVKPVLQIRKDGEVLCEYISMVDAERKTGVDNSKICACCKGNRKTAGGYIWKYKNKEVDYE